MAMVLEAGFEFGSGSRAKKYAWHTWTDGQAWQLTQGEDFACTVKTMQLQAYRFAKANGLKVHVKPLSQTSIVLQFYTAV